MFGNVIKKRNTFKKISNIINTNPKVFYLQKGFFYPNFFYRIVGIVLTEKGSIINSWHYNNSLSRWSFSKILSISFFKYDIFLSKKIFLFLNFFKKKINIYLQNNDIVLFGPWPNIYAHQLVDFILRINFIKNIKYKRVFVPFFLKKILTSNPYKKIFFNMNFVFYNYENNIIFHNLRYLSGINHYSKNQTLRNTIVDLNTSIHQKFNLVSKELKCTFISRSKSTRSLKNEDQLYKMLSKYNFKRYYFENLSYLEQIRISYNSKIIISVHGSGLANLIFMKKNSNLIEMTNSFIKNPIFKLLSIITKINYFNLPFKVNNSNLTGLVDVDLVEKKVQTLLKKR
jgi:hypothetical protein